MDIGQAQVGIVVAIKTFDDYFKALYNTGLFPKVFSGDYDTPMGRVNATTRLESPEFALTSDSTNDSYTRLHVTGLVEIRPEGETTGTPIAVLPLDTWVRLTPVLREEPGEVPLVGFDYEGVDEPPDEPLSAEMVDDIFQTDPVKTIIRDLKIDLLGKLVDELAKRIYPNPDERPDPDAWHTTLRLMPASVNGLSEQDYIDALGVYVAQPGIDSNPGEISSFLPSLTEFGLVYERQLLDYFMDVHAKAKLAEANEGHRVNGAKLIRLDVSMGDEAILVDGEVEKDDATVEFKGPIKISLIRGTMNFAADASELNIKEPDLPWYVDLVRFLNSPYANIPTIGLSGLLGSIGLRIAGTSYGEIETEIAAIPSTVRGAIGQDLADALNALATGLKLEGPLGEVPRYSTPDSSIIRNGHLAVFAQLFIIPLTAAIVDGRYSMLRRRFREFKLAGGRWFAVSELARLVLEDIINTPGCHAVRRLKSVCQECGYVYNEPGTAFGFVPTDWVCPVCRGAARDQFDTEYLPHHMRANPNSKVLDNLLRKYRR